jgi:hypothetical protein
MYALKPVSYLRLGAALWALVLATPLPAATLWTGPNMTYTKSASTPNDTILAGKVVLHRGTRDVLYNTAAGETRAATSSPANTEWGFGALTNYQNLSYRSLESMRDGNLAGLILNRPMVMHIISEDIYLSVKFTTWGQHGVGTVSYIRSTAPAGAAPTVSITSPQSGAVFAAPATVALSASATVTGGTVTNVQYFAGATSLGSATAAPFSLSASIPAAGNYALTAVATAAGVSSTSAVVNVSIVMPASVSLSSAGIQNGSFSFNYSADPGLSYVVQASANLADWVPLATNVATSATATFSDSNVSSAARFYRVGRLLNP